MGMVKREYFTLYEGTRTVEPELAEIDDLQLGAFGDEEDLNQIQMRRVVGRITDQSIYLANFGEVKRPRAHFPANTDIEIGWRVKRDKTGTIYVVSDVIHSDMVGADVIVALAD